MRKKAVILGLLAMAGTAGAQQVWRCGNAYSSQPCPRGTPVSLASPLGAGDPARATAAAKVDARRADALEQARLAREKKAPQAIVMAPVAPAAAAPAAKPPPRKPGAGKGKLETFTATAPGKPDAADKKKNRKARPSS